MAGTVTRQRTEVATTESLLPTVGPTGAMQHVFITGMTGSGKSTVASELLDGFHDKNPDVAIYIFDPKKRYHPVAPRDARDTSATTPTDKTGGDTAKNETGLFPNGLEPRVNGRRSGVEVVAELLAAPKLHEGGVFVLQDATVITDFYAYIYANQDVTLPIILFLDEPADADAVARAEPGLRKLYREGRELGVGVWTIEQRPRFVDKLAITQATIILTFDLGGPDRQYIAAETGVPELAEPVEQYAFRYVNKATNDKVYITIKRSDVHTREANAADTKGDTDDDDATDTEGDSRGTNTRPTVRRPGARGDVAEGTGGDTSESAPTRPTIVTPAPRTRKPVPAQIEQPAPQLSGFLGHISAAAGPRRVSQPTTSKDDAGDAGEGITPTQITLIGAALIGAAAVIVWGAHTPLNDGAPGPTPGPMLTPLSPRPRSYRGQ